jgi:hypothetical protein
MHATPYGGNCFHAWSAICFSEVAGGLSTSNVCPSTVITGSRIHSNVTGSMNAGGHASSAGAAAMFSLDNIFLMKSLILTRSKKNELTACLILLFILLID